MIDKFDYLEPRCPLTGGKDFYDPQKDAPLGRIPVARIIEKVDSAFDRNDYPEAGRLLETWQREAIALKDRQGELSMCSELIGYYRKQGDGNKGLACISRALQLVEELEQGTMASGATIFINCATAYQAFGFPEKSIPLYTQAEEVYRKVLSPEDPRFGGLYNNMALALADLERYADAATAYASALAVMERAPQGEAECAITWINLAYLYARWKKPEKIDACMEKAYTLLQSRNLPRDGYYAFVLEKCAPAFRDFGNMEAYQILTKTSEEIYARN